MADHISQIWFASCVGLKYATSLLGNALINPFTTIVSIAVAGSNARLDQTSDFVLNLFVAQTCWLTLLSKMSVRHLKLF